MFSEEFFSSQSGMIIQPGRMCLHGDVVNLQWSLWQSGSFRWCRCKAGKQRQTGYLYQDIYISAAYMQLHKCHRSHSWLFFFFFFHFLPHIPTQRYFTPCRSFSSNNLPLSSPHSLTFVSRPSFLSSSLIWHSFFLSIFISPPPPSSSHTFSLSSSFHSPSPVLFSGQVID